MTAVADVAPAVAVERPRVEATRLRVPWGTLAVVAAAFPFLLALGHGDSAWIGNQGDAKLFAWYLDDVATSLRHGHLPLTTDLIDHPAGVNLLWNTSVLLLGVVATPLTLTLGPVFTYNVLVILGVGLSTLAAYVALCRFTHVRPAAALGAFVYGASPFITSETVGHLHLAFAVYPPIALLLIDSVVRRNARPWRAGALLGVATAAQLLIGEELVLLTAIGAGVGLAVAASQHPASVRACMPRVLWMLASASLAGGVLAAPILAFQFFGPQHLTAAMNTYLLNADAAGLVVPTPTRLLSPPWNGPAQAVEITVDDAGAYIGIPLLVLIVLRWGRLVTDPRSRFALVTGAIALVLSFGETLRVAGRSAGMPLPWAVLDQFPLVRDAAPARLTVVVDLMLALIVAVTAEHLVAQRFSARGRRPAIALLALGVAAILPVVPTTTTADTTPAFFTSAAARIPDGANVLVLPWPDSTASEAMLWQMRAGMRWSMPAGEAFSSGATLDGTDSLLHAVISDLDRRGIPVPDLGAVRSQLAHDLLALHVDAIVVGPSPNASRVESLLTTLLGVAPDHVEGVAVWWHVPA